MSLSAAAIRTMADKGLSAADIADIAEANELRSDPTAAARQRRCRENKKANSHAVTVTRDTVSLKEDQNPSGEVLPNEAIASLPIRQPVSEAAAAWNEVAASAGWPQVASLSANRQKLLSARLREHGLDGWRAAVARARASPYLAGPDPPSWFTFPWLIKAENFLKLIEGNYDRRRNESTDPTFGALADFNRIIAGNVGSSTGAGEMPQAGGTGIDGPSRSARMDKLGC